MIMSKNTNHINEKVSKTFPIPWSVQIELTEGCTRRCPMCGIQSTGWERDHFKFMTLDLAVEIAVDLDMWIPQGRRIEFALQGEPLANPRVAQIIRIFRDEYPKSQLLISTNGDLITTELVDKLFRNGLNTLLVNCYDDKTRPIVEEILKPLTKRGMTNVNASYIHEYDFYKDNPKVYSYQGNVHQEIIYIDSVLNKDGESRIRKLNNQAGSGKLNSGKTLPLKTSCSNVFRELVIKYDGTIMACCMDWIRKMPVGNIRGQTLKEIWQGEMFNSVRKHLYNYERNKLELCSACDYSGYKNGIARNDWKHIFERTENEVQIDKKEIRV